MTYCATIPAEEPNSGSNDAVVIFSSETESWFGTMIWNPLKPYAVFVMPSTSYSLFPKNWPLTKVALNSEGFSPMPIWKKFWITPGTVL